MTLRAYPKTRPLKLFGARRAGQNLQLGGLEPPTSCSTERVCRAAGFKLHALLGRDAHDLDFMDTIGTDQYPEASLGGWYENEWPDGVALLNASWSRRMKYAEW